MLKCFFTTLFLSVTFIIVGFRSCSINFGDLLSYDIRKFLYLISVRHYGWTFSLCIPIAEFLPEFAVLYFPNYRVFRNIRILHPWFYCSVPFFKLLNFDLKSIWSLSMERKLFFHNLIIWNCLSLNTMISDMLSEKFKLFFSSIYQPLH